MKHHWRKMLEADAEGRPHLAGALCEWCRISKTLDDMPADIRAMFHSREASDLRVAWAWLHAEFPGECSGESVGGHDYRVVASDRLELLVAEVSKAMGEGWQASGSLIVYDDTCHGLTHHRYCQPMVRR